MSKVTVLRNVSIFAGLSDHELEALADSLEKRIFNKGTVIFHKGSPGHTMYIIESGKVRIFILSESGQEVTINIYGPGDVFGDMAVFDSLPRSAGAIAMEQTVTFTLHRDDFLRYLRAYPQMAQSIIEMLSTRLRYTTTYAESLAFLGVCGRVAAKLLELAERHGVQKQGIEIELQLTQGELASWVGTTRESVSKVLSIFREQGLIEVEGQKITILDRQGLKKGILGSGQRVNDEV